MTDTPSFRDVVEETTKEVEVTPSEAQKVEETAIESTQEQPETEETFAEKGELAGKTPEQLEEIYKNWQRSYTEKRQKETQKLKELEAKLAQLETTPTAQPVEQRVEAAQQALNLGQMTVQQYTEYMKQLTLEQAREAAKEEYQQLVVQQREEQLAEQARNSFENADTRLNQHAPDFDEKLRDEVRREMAELLDKHLEETGSYQGFDAETLTKKIIERKDREIDELIKKRTLQSTQAAKMREAKAMKSATRGTTGDSQPVGGSSIRNILSEAIDSAA